MSGTAAAMDARSQQPSVADDLIDGIRAMPKVDLHVHLTGAVRAGTVRDLIPPTVRPAATGDQLAFEQPVTDYSDFFNPWRRILRHMPDTPLVVSRLVRELAADLVTDGVVYAEVRISLRQPAEMGYLDEYLAAIEEATDWAADHGTVIRVVGGVAQHRFKPERVHDPRQTLKQILYTCESFRDVVVGFDVWGNQRVPSTIRGDSWLAHTIDAGFPVSVHLGEREHDDDMQRLLRLRPSRVSHGPAIVNDLMFVNELNSRGTAVELCLSSNWLTGSATNWGGEAAVRLRARGVPVIICTDDPSVLRTSMSRELGLAIGMGLITEGEIPALTLEAVDYSFADEATKESLRRVISDATESRREVA